MRVYHPSPYAPLEILPSVERDGSPQRAAAFDSEIPTEAWAKLSAPEASAVDSARLGMSLSAWRTGAAAPLA